MSILRPDEYIVHNVIDKRLIKKDTGMVIEYRVRWEGYGPSQDSWEPIESFNLNSIGFVTDFDRLYGEMHSELKSRVDVGLDTSREVNILSREIDEIVKKKYEKDDKNKIINTWYRVKWKNVLSSENSWESDQNLLHAQDKINLFLHSQRIKCSSRKRKSSLSPSICRQDENNKQKITIDQEHPSADAAKSTSTDMYSTVKSRRHKKQVLSTIEDGKVENNIYLGNLFDNLPKYDAAKTRKILREQACKTLLLSRKEFITAVDAGDYPRVFASLRHSKVSKVNFDKLFLASARKGFRDIAILLATRVSDLSIEDDYGFNALAMAANNSDALFAHQLVEMGMLLDQPSSKGHTARSVAEKHNDKKFLEFLNNYKLGTTPF